MIKVFKYLKDKLNTIKDLSGNKEIIRLTYLFSAIFFALICYVLIVVYRDSASIINNSYNKREELYAKKTVRGSILSSNKEVLAYTDTSDSNENRVYPYGRLFAHVVGYNIKGKAGLESSANFTLLQSNAFILERINNELNSVKNIGDNIITTLDINTQLAAYEALSNKTGAVVVMDAETGHILAMVSKPDFDPNNISDIWDSVVNEKGNTTLLNKATQGLYPPGSTFKILTALEYMKENDDYNDYSFDCPGYFEYKGTKINCYHGIKHGQVDLNASFSKSCNASFANITTKLNENKFKNTCEELLFNESIPSPSIIDSRSSFIAKKSYVPINSKSTPDELIQTGIGQGKTEVSPYHMCLISAAIANEGVLMNPILVESIENYTGDIVSSARIRPYKRLLSKEDSDKVKELMRGVITDGTGTKLKDAYGYTAYGKTGSAEFSSNKTESHAWFTGFAEGNNGKKIAISVIIENGGSGGQVAIPVARAVFDSYFNR